MKLFPNSNGEDASLTEFNANHEPAGSPVGGRFARSRDTMRVGITSAVDGQAPGVFAHMREFEKDLRRVPGVAAVSVRKGVGAWEGREEPSWIVSYVGNGEARRLLARTAVRYDQEAVLLMGRCKGVNCDPAVDLRFDRPVTRGQMRAIGGVLSAAGLGGWTWGRVGKKTVLRAVSVPAWGGKAAAHVKSMARVSAELSKRGFTHKSRTKLVKTEVIDRSNYGAVIEGRA